jgi:iron complex transport system substrate-binding protein
MKIFASAMLGATLALTLTVGSAWAQTRNFTDDLGRSVEIPETPQRIVSLHDVWVSIPLLELGAPLVGSHGRTDKDGKPFLRSANTLIGVDFDTSNIEFVGNLPADVEAVANLAPDLIITSPWQSAPLEQLEEIAPTIVLNDDNYELLGIYEPLAEITGTKDRLETLRRRYDSQIAQIKRLIDTENISVSVLYTEKGQIGIKHTLGMIAKVLRDAGFQFPEVIDNVPGNQTVMLSAEALPQLDTDFIFDTYRTDTLETRADVIARLEELMPGYCEFLFACVNNQYIAVPREEGWFSSYYGLGLMTMTVVSNIAGRDYVTQQ